MLTTQELPQNCREFHFYHLCKCQWQQRGRITHPRPVSPAGVGTQQPRSRAARPYAARGRRSLGTALPAASGVGTQEVTAQPLVHLPSRLSSCHGKWLSGGKQQELQMCLPHHNTSLCICRFQSRPLPH